MQYCQRYDKQEWQRYDKCRVEGITNNNYVRHMTTDGGRVYGKHLMNRNGKSNGSTGMTNDGFRGVTNSNGGRGMENTARQR